MVFLLLIYLMLLQKKIKRNREGITYSDQQHIGLIHSKEGVGPFYYSFYHLVAKIHSL